MLEIKKKSEPVMFMGLRRYKHYEKIDLCFKRSVLYKIRKSSFKIFNFIDKKKIVICKCPFKKQGTRP